ncbi:MAG: vWA domain-containing protein [Spirochaetaceae bacterium]
MKAGWRRDWRGRGAVVLCLLFGSAGILAAQDLSVSEEDLRIEQSLDGGYVLVVRDKPDIASVLVTESTEDPDREVASYAYQNPEYHPMNGDEPRILEGEFLDTDRYYLIDSSPEDDEEFESAYHIFVPYVVTYGYSWSRSGEVQLLDGAYLNVRTFTEPYADYRGRFQDNPFVLRVQQAPEEGPPEGNYMSETEEAFEDIARETEGVSVHSAGEEDVPGRIAELVRDAAGESLDFVLAVDTTESMRNDVPFLKRDLVPLLEEELADFELARVGMVYYRDYNEEYLTRNVGLQPNLSAVQQQLDRIRVGGGRDIPEAVYEALYVSLTEFPWESETRMVILVGDAPPHPRPRGGVDREMVGEAAREHGVEVNTIILPH